MTLDLTPEKVATLGAVLWTLRITMARMAGHNKKVRQWRAATRAALAEQSGALAETCEDIDDGDAPMVAPAAKAPEFAKQVRVVDSILRKLCGRAQDNLNLTSEEVATLGAVLWTLYVLMARIAGVRHCSTITAQAVPEGLREALAETYADIDDEDVPLLTSVSTDPNFAMHVRVVDSILQELCIDHAQAN